MKNSSTSRFFLPTVVGFMLGLLFLYLFLLPMPDVFEKSFGWLYFPAFFLCFACFGHYLILATRIQLCFVLLCFSGCYSVCSSEYAGFILGEHKISHPPNPVLGCKFRW
jgi:hypothetical protein